MRKFNTIVFFYSGPDNHIFQEMEMDIHLKGGCRYWIRTQHMLTPAWQ